MAIFKAGVTVGKKNTYACKKLLAGGWTTHLKNMLVKLDHFTNFRGENTKIVETTAKIIKNRYINEV